MGFVEQAAQTGFVLGRLVEGGQESLPLFGVEHESGLIGESLLGSLPGATHNEIGNVDTLPFGCDLNEGLFRSSSAKLETPVAGGVGYRDSHISPRFHCTATVLQYSSTRYR